MNRIRSLLLLISIACLILDGLIMHPAHGQDDHDHDHDHEDEDNHDDDQDQHDDEIRIAALFSKTTDPVSLVWTKTAQQIQPRLYFVGVGGDETSTCGKEQLDIARHSVEDMMEQLEHHEMSVTEVHPMDLIVPSTVVEINSDADASIAFYPANFSAFACVAVFGIEDLHELGLAFVNMATGQALEIALLEEYAEEEEHFLASDVAANAIGGAIVVCIIPLAILAFILPLGLFNKSETLKTGFYFLNAFGCSALLSVVALHLYPEMVLETQEANLPFWQGGSLVLAGIFSVALIHFFADKLANRPSTHLHHHGGDNMAATDVEKTPAEVTDEEHSPQKPPRENSIETASTNAMPDAIRLGTCKDLLDFKRIHPLIWGITLGDALHNFVDGCLIGAGFLACGNVLGWTTVAAIIAHEVPQELGDMSLMLSTGATLGQALLFNLIAQMTSILGCGIVIGVGDSLPRGQLSLLLAFGIGTFLFIALTDIMPMLLAVTDKKQRYAQYIIAIVGGVLLAAMAIGLSTTADEGTCSGHSHQH